MEDNVLKTKSGVTITNEAEQMGRWAEHYAELYSQDS